MPILYYKNLPQNQKNKKKTTQDGEEEPEALGEVVGKRGSKRGSVSLGVEAGEGCKKNPFSFIAFSSASASKHEPGLLAAADRSNGSGMSGVTGLRTSEGKSRMLGDRISGFHGDDPELLLEKTGIKGLSLRLLREFLRS